MFKFVLTSLATGAFLALTLQAKAADWACRRRQRPLGPTSAAVAALHAGGSSFLVPYALDPPALGGDHHGLRHHHGLVAAGVRGATRRPGDTITVSCTAVLRRDDLLLVAGVARLPPPPSSWRTGAGGRGGERYEWRPWTARQNRVT